MIPESSREGEEESKLNIKIGGGSGNSFYSDDEPPPITSGRDHFDIEDPVEIVGVHYVQHFEDQDDEHIVIDLEQD